MNDLERTLYQAKSELAALRRENQLLAAKVSVIELVERLVMPGGGNSPMGEDLIFLIDRELGRLAKEREVQEAKNANRVSEGAKGETGIYEPLVPRRS
jgi:hypothetical protein